MRKNLIGCGRSRRRGEGVDGASRRSPGGDTPRRDSRAAEPGFVASLSRGLSEPALAAARRACEACARNLFCTRQKTPKTVLSAAKFRAACCPVDQPHTAVYT